MQIDELGRISYSSYDLIREVYKGNLDKIHLADVIVDDDYIKYLEYIEKNSITDWPIPMPQNNIYEDIKSFDKRNQEGWLMPNEYKNFPIQEYLLKLCVTDKEIERVVLELQRFEKHNMVNVLRFLKFLIDKMREKNIVWGVGRGSSVASYCLYLLGVHKIDSLKYDLDINEFLK